MLGTGALGRPRGMVGGGRREEGSGWILSNLELKRYIKKKRKKKSNLVPIDPQYVMPSFAGKMYRKIRNVSANTTEGKMIKVSFLITLCVIKYAAYFEISQNIISIMRYERRPIFIVSY